jgi:hypothetical protein
MDQAWLEELERQLSATSPPGAPPELRRVVLADIARELRAVRWDRRLARAAVVLLLVGVGLNAALAWRGAQQFDARPARIAEQASSESLVETAIVIAEATNAETGRTFARQLAALSGRELTDQEIASINAATTRDRG